MRKNSILSERPRGSAKFWKPFSNIIGPVPLLGIVPDAFITSDSLAYKET